MGIAQAMELASADSVYHRIWGILRGAETVSILFWGTMSKVSRGRARHSVPLQGELCRM